MPQSKVERARVNQHLRAHGLGDLNDPTLLDQLAFLIRSHEKFSEMLMRVTPEERANAYRALAPRLRFFKPNTLEQYELEAKQKAESLPVYDNKTLAVTMPGEAKVSGDMREAITGKTLEERREAERVKAAENAIAEDWGKSTARGRLEIFCSKCMFGTTVYAKDRSDAYLTLLANGWKLSGDQAFCPDCHGEPREA
jgi:hypothetical protein